jgi:hypothetical protein
LALRLVAVDSETGEHIANIIWFLNSGSVIRRPVMKKALEDAGYDPHEHNNQYDDLGRIIIE